MSRGADSSRHRKERPMPRNGKVKASVVIALATLAVCIVGGAWAYTLKNGERVTKIETRVDYLEQTVARIDEKLSDGIQSILEAISRGEDHAGRSEKTREPLGNL